jgi:hypothetical protein
MKGISGSLMAILITVILAISIISVVGLLSVQLAVPPRVVEVEYEGEFDDAYLATKAWFYSDFTEQVDCNVTSDVLGGSDYSSCIYRSATAWNATADSSVNSRDWQFDLVIDIDDDVENMDISVELQNTGTGQAADDVVIKEAALYTYEDDPTLVKDLSPFIEDNVEIDGETGVLEGDEYVLHIVFHTKSISPDFATGDDIARIDLDLDTDGDVDSARITVESS